MTCGGWSVDCQGRAIKKRCGDCISSWRSLAHSNLVGLFQVLQQDRRQLKRLVMTTTDSEDVETITLKILLSYEACGIAVLTYRGGLELLFANKRKFNFSLPAKFSDPQQPSTINYLIKQLCEREMKDKRKELFIKDDTV